MMMTASEIKALEQSQAKEEEESFTDWTSSWLQWQLPAFLAQQEASNLWALPAGLGASEQYPSYLNDTAGQQREAFYRSCSQGWLNAMLDVELGTYP